MCAQSDQVHVIAAGEIDDTACRAAFQNDRLHAKDASLTEPVDDSFQIFFRVLLFQMPVYRVDCRGTASILSLLQNMQKSNTRMGHGCNCCYMGQNALCQRRTVQRDKNMIEHKSLHTTILFRTMKAPMRF